MTQTRRTALSGLVLLLFGLAACADPSGSEEGPTLVRLENQSPYTLEDVTFSSGHDPLHFPSIGAGDRTDYRLVDRAYRYGYLEVFVAGERFVLQPIDYVGEDPLGRGSFTYRIQVDPAARTVGVQLVHDR